MFTIERSNVLPALNYAVLQYNGNCPTIGRSMQTIQGVLPFVSQKQFLIIVKYLLFTHLTTYPFNEH